MRVWRNSLQPNFEALVRPASPNAARPANIGQARGCENQDFGGICRVGPLVGPLAVNELKKPRSRGQWRYQRTLVSTKPPVAVAKTDQGKVDEETVQLYTLTNKNGLQLKVSSYGTIVTELHVPDKAGKLADIVLGYYTLDEYVKATST
jgi:hypothetical protein